MNRVFCWLQTLGAAALIYSLQRKVRLRLAGQAAIDSLKKFLAPTGEACSTECSSSAIFACMSTVFADHVHIQELLKLWGCCLILPATVHADQSVVARADVKLQKLPSNET